MTCEELDLTFMSAPAVRTFVIDITGIAPFTLPSAGVGVSSVLFSSSFAENGVLVRNAVPTVTQICSLTGTVVEYSSNLPGAAADISFRWISGPTDLSPGDTVTFKLTDSDPNLGALSRF